MRVTSRKTEVGLCVVCGGEFTRIVRPGRASVAVRCGLCKRREKNERRTARRRGVEISPVLREYRRHPLAKSICECGREYAGTSPICPVCALTPYP